ncbi:MAG TPA: xanthine dehydrogenase family protein subunit M [Thermoanaerobaculia bacterium]
MYPASFDYHRPASLAEAAHLLKNDPDARLLAGGHSLLPAMRLRLSVPTALVDLSGIAGLAGIGAAGGGLVIGAMTTHAAVADSAAVRSACPLLAETAAQIGDLQVRNRGTIGGSLAHADPAADYPAPLTALGATIETGGAAARQIPVEGFFQGLFTTDLQPGEIVTAVHVPAYGPGTGGAYVKHRHPASGFAVVGVAALVTVEGGKCAKVSLVVGGVQANPVRAQAAEAALTGQAPGEAAFAAAAAKVAESLTKPLSDLYASGEFRVHLAGVLAKRALAQATGRAGA